MSRLLFLGISQTMAGVLFFIYLLFTKKLPQLGTKKAWIHMLGTALFIVIIPSIFISRGAALVDGITVSIFHQTELFFTFITCAILYNERITSQKVLGGLVTFIGATTILYNGSLDLGLGVFYIIMAAFFYPFGNISSKNSMKYVSSGTVLFVRSIIGGPILIPIAYYLDGTPSDLNGALIQNLPELLFTGVIVYFATKFMWYEGIKRIEIGKAVSINLIMPAISIIFSILFFNNYPTIQEAIGLIFVAIGLYFITKKSIAPKKIGTE